MNKIVENTKKSILMCLRDALENIQDKEEIYFHDIVTQEIDSQTPQDRHECLELIDLSNPEHFDEGMIDKSSVDRMLITTAYCSLEEQVFNDDFFQELQNKLNNEIISKAEAIKIIAKINEVLK